MKAIDFKHSNTVFAKDQPEYQSLPALKIDTPSGEVVTCWKMSFIERLKVLFTGKVWMSLMMFNQPLTPSYLSVNRKDVYLTPEDVAECNHAFPLGDVVDIGEDPTCVKCGGLLSELCKEE